LLFATAGCRSILGIDPPDPHATDATPPGDGVDGDGSLAFDAPMVDALVPDAPPGAPTVIQASSNDVVNTGSINVSFNKAVATGDLIVVAIGVVDPSPTITLTDSQSSSFQVAAAATGSQNFSESTWYAFAGGSGNDTITAKFGGTKAEIDVRIAEYRGVSQLGTVDAQTGNSGQSNLCTATLTTVTANDLLVASNFGPGGTAGSGSGYDERTQAVPNGPILEDRIAITPGQAQATIRLGGSAPWVMQLVAFRP
jgi:hypothetical protein